jgi:hypothetical protein
MSNEIEYGKLDKRISFMDTDKRNADLIIRLKQDGLTKTKFFRAILDGYLNQDDRIMEFVNEYKLESGSQSKKKAKVVQSKIEQGKENKRKFGLNEDEIENIFDILEKQNPDL